MEGVSNSKPANGCTDGAINGVYQEFAPKLQQRTLDLLDRDIRKALCFRRTTILTTQRERVG